MHLIIDIGSNTVRAVIFRVDGKKIIPVLNKKYSAGLANYINKKELMSEEGVELLIEILTEIRIIIDAFPLDGIYPFATASLRNIKNSKEVLERVKCEVGLDIALLSGEQEAYFDYYASLRTSDEEEPQGVLTDIGGGSTEIVIHYENQPIVTESLPIGSLNMYNRYTKDILPSKSEREKIYTDAFDRLKKEDFRHVLKQLDIKLDHLCGVGGTCRSTLKCYNAVNGKKRSNLELSVKFLDDLYKGKYSDKELSKIILKAAPERIHTMVPGAMVLKAVADYFDLKTIKIHTSGVREGYLYHNLEQEGGFHA